MAAVLYSGIGSVQLVVDPPTDVATGELRDDLSGIKVWCSNTPNFTPDSSNLKYDGSGLTVTIPNLLDGTTYYVKYALISAIEPSEYVVSEQLSASTDPPGATYISYIATDTEFRTTDTGVSPTVIPITFLLNGRLQGTPTITTENLTSDIAITVVDSTKLIVAVPYTSVLADTSSVTATLVYNETTYTATVKLFGKVTAPANVGAGASVVVEGGLLKLSWPKSADIGLAGYEIREQDTNWGQDTNYVFNGSSTSCLVSPGVSPTVGTTKKFYIRAYNGARLYSPGPVLVEYVIPRPLNVSDLKAEFSSSSATTSSAVVSWSPVVPEFGLKAYRVLLTLPNLNTKQWTVSTPNISLDATWTGQATVVIYTIDALNNESTGSATLKISKEPPATVIAAATPVSVIGTDLTVSWKSPTKTTLPVVSYEVRNADIEWGNPSSSTLLWKGAATSCQVRPGALETATNYYVRAIDSDNIYSTSSLALSYTRTRPSTVANLNYAYSITTSTGKANVTFSWTKPTAETFAIKSYRLTFTKPGPVVVSIETYSTSWTTDVDWLGEASVSIQTIDVLGAESIPYTLPVYNVPTSVQQYALASPTVVTDTLQISWTPVTTSASLAWTRVNNVATIVHEQHGYQAGDLIRISLSSDTSSIPVQEYKIASTTADTYTISCNNTGALSGTLVISYGSLNTVEYELRNAAGEAIYRGSSTNYSVPGNELSIGQNKFYLFAVDVAGMYSKDSLEVLYTYERLSGIVGTAKFTSIGTALFSWSAPSSGSFKLKEYSLSLTGLDNSSTQNATDWEIPVTWSSSTATLVVTPIDVIGNQGVATSIPLTNTLLTVDTSVVSTLKGTSLELDWSDIVVNSATQLPVGYYELLDFDGNVVWKGAQSKAIIPLEGVTPQKRTWYLYAYDSNGYKSSNNFSYEYTDLVNPSPISLSTVNHSFGTNITDSLLTISWAYENTRFGLKYYKISYLDGSTTVSTTVLSNSINISPIPKGQNNEKWVGQKAFDISVVDNLGNESEVVRVLIEKNKPGKIKAYTSQVIDNNVLLQWDLPARTTLPISTVRLKRGTTWNTANEIGNKTGTFTTILERIGGEYTYWAAAVDSDGVESDPAALATTVSQPPDYIFLDQQYSTFNQTKVNAVLDDQEVLRLPVDLTGTWSEHFASNSWNSPQDQIAANYPRYIQPTLGSGYYEEVFNFGAVLSSSKVTVSFTGTVLAGEVAVVTTIDLSPDGVTWLANPIESQSVFGTNFKYAKVRITVTQEDGGRGLYSISGLNIYVDAKQRTDSNTIVLAVGDAEPQGNVGPDYVSLWYPGALETTTAFVVNGTTQENSISYAEGVSDHLQAIWECSYTSAGFNPNGGWNLASFKADTTKSHLFAIFVQTSSSSGTFKWGTTPNDGILNLDDTTNLDPYFWTGTLPTNDEWYLVVGFIHGSGYTGADTGVSGVYDLNGTKVLSGIEFKPQAGLANLAHRAQYNYTGSPSATVAQKMSRPTVIESTIGMAQNTINYILQCATEYGASVTPISELIDIISITATPQGTQPTTVIVDFMDIPNPKRFNLFNYNTNGSLAAGTASWTVRGY